MTEIAKPLGTVLLVEDNEDNRIIYRTILEYHGYRVVLAGDGAQGIDLARAHLPDVILMDVALPVIDGLEAAQAIKRDPSTASIPIIALTAHALHGDREKAEEAGCDGYLAKPCEPRAVLDAVRRQLGHPGTSGSVANLS